MLRKRIGARRALRKGIKGTLKDEEEEEWVEDFEVEGDKSEQQGLDDGSYSGSVPSDVKLWTEEDKAIYEQQLEHLHDQLTQALVENQELKVKLKETKLQNERATPTTKSKKVVTKYGQFQGNTLSTSTTREGFESVSSQSPSDVAQRSSGRTRLVDKFKDWFFDILYDFTEEHYDGSDEEASEAPPLQARKLKDNLKRLGNSSKPYREFGQFLLGIIQWKSPSLSLVVFLLYMYCVWTGWVLQLILSIIILYLAINYLHAIGILEQFGFQSKSKANEDDDFGSLGIADKFQLVKEVGKMVQNMSEMVADNLEKAQNLLLWRCPQTTRKVFFYLCLGFCVSLFLPNSWTLSLIGLGLGYKVFIIDNVYRKYPKVKEKYDGVARMWRSLPTNNELVQRQRMTEEDMSSQAPADSTPSESSFVSVADTLFTERFQLSLTELPVEGWQTGRRCSLIDKDHPLNSKSGRLFLTHSYLCFERSPRPSDTADRFAVPLDHIVSMAKAKPFAVLPGSGMSIEVILRNNPKPIIFGAILHRDQAYQALCDQAMVLGLNWGSDPEENNGTALEPSHQTETLQQTLN